MTQGLNDDQVRALLAIAAMHDKRQLTESAVALWVEASKIGRWDFVTARDAIVWHVANDPEYLKPAHITRYIRAQRQQPQHIHAQRALPRPAPAGTQHVRDILTTLGKQLGWKARGQAHDPAIAVRCPHCHAAPGQPCTRHITRGPRAGQYAPLAQPHPSRIAAAEETP